jgi:tetratricopeptide (TPR) repeat protein
MELLKTFLLIGVFSIMSVTVAQENTDQIISAFTESYTLEKEGDYAKAIETIKKVYKEDNYELNMRLGWLHYSSGLFTESQAYYQKAADLMPMAEEALAGLSYPAAALGHWDQVISLYKKILQLHPNSTLYNYKLGSIYYGREEYVKAAQFLEKVVNLYPFDYDGILLMAWTNLKLGKTREAKVLFNKVLMLSPDDSSAKEGLELLK